MPIDKAEGIVLRTEKIGEQDKLAVVFTRERGILRGVAKGARKFANRFGCSLEPLSLVRVHFYEKERRELVTISDCDLLESSFEAQRDPRTAATLAYFAELVEEVAPVRMGDDVLYRLMLSVLKAMREGGDPSFLARYFEAWFLRINGYLPDVRRCRKCRKPLVAEAAAEANAPAPAPEPATSAGVREDTGPVYWSPEAADGNGAAAADNASAPAPDAGTLPPPSPAPATKPAPPGAFLSPRRDGIYCARCAPMKRDEVPPEFASFLAWVRRNPPPGREGAPFTPEQSSRFRKVLRAMIVFHLEREPRTLRATEE